MLVPTTPLVVSPEAGTIVQFPGLVYRLDEPEVVAREFPNFSSTGSR